LRRYDIELGSGNRFVREDRDEIVGDLYKSAIDVIACGMSAVTHAHFAVTKAAD